MKPRRRERDRDNVASGASEVQNWGSASQRIVDWRGGNRVEVLEREEAVAV